MTAKGPPGLQRNPPGSGSARAQFARGKNWGLLRFAVSGKLVIAKSCELPGNRTMQTRLSRRVLRFYGFGVVPREKGTHTRPIPRAPRACPIIASSSTRQAVTLARRAGSDLTTWPEVRCSWESEQYKNGAGEMVPLYAARVQDLGTDDFFVIKCGACGHTAEIPPSGLIRGLRRSERDSATATPTRIASY
jgi:hypothetical protein